MSRTYPKLKNKYQRHQKVQFQQYLYNASEPREDISSGMADEFEDELFDNTESMRREFRYRAHQMRSRQS